MIAQVKTDQLNEMLFRKGWSRRQLAATAGIGGVTAQQVCNGKRNPSAPVAKKIVDALGCEFDDVFQIVDSYSETKTIKATFPMLT